MSAKVVIISNQGRFGSGFIKYISESKDIELIKSYVIDTKYEKSSIARRCQDISNSMKLLKPDFCFYISGETREPSRMSLLNIDFPKQIASICSDKHIKFVYLSSLAVWAGVNQLKVNLSTSHLAIDNYGKTKSRFDCWIRKNRCNNKDGLTAYIVYPASFYSGNGRSAIEKLEAGFYKFKLIFRYLGFSGSLSYIDINDIYRVLRGFALGEYQRDVLLSNSKSVEDISSLVFGTRPKIVIPRIPMFFWRIVFYIVPKRVYAISKYIFTGVDYLDEK